jgi:predicted nucleic acid-binding protein
LPPNAGIILNLLTSKISKQHKIHFFDSLLAATMQENGISKILTENVKDFNKIAGIEAENPFDMKGSR